MTLSSGLPLAPGRLWPELDLEPGVDDDDDEFDGISPLACSENCPLSLRTCTAIGLRCDVVGVVPVVGMAVNVTAVAVGMVRGSYAILDALG